MSDRPLGGCGCRENSSDSVCIQTNKVYDSCRDKECVENIRVYLTQCGQNIIDKSINVKCRKSEIIWIYSDVEPVPFNRGYYTVDLKFFFRIVLDVFTGIGRPVQVEGLATFDKKVILFGSEGNAKTFSSKYKFDEGDIQLWTKNNLPLAKTEVVDPICLGAKVIDSCENCCCCGEMDITAVPESVSRIFDDIIVDPESGKRVYITLGLFTIVRLERETQLLIPVIDYCVPQNECISSTDNSPCELFDRLRFPIDEFFPPEKQHFDNLEPDAHDCCCD